MTDPSIAVAPRSVVGAISHLVVGGALAWAGVAKLAAGHNWPRQAADLRVDRTVAAVVPWVDLGVGAAVISGFRRPVPTVAAGGLLAVYTGFVVIRLQDDERPPCACFGRRSSQPLSARHVVRNSVLVGLAGAAIMLS